MGRGRSLGAAARGPRAAHGLPAAETGPEITDPGVVGRLAGAQVERLAQRLQGTHGNRQVAGWLGSVQRAPASQPAEPADAASARSYRITTLTARLNTKPSFLGRAVETLSRGDAVTPAGEERGGWLRVTTQAGTTGWLHRSAISSGTPHLSSAPGSGGGARPGPDEIEVGGRG